MKRGFKIWIVLLLSIRFASAQTGEFRSLLFKVTTEQDSHVSYLFGTHHAFGKAFFEPLTVARQSRAMCNLLIKENLNIPGQMAEDIINRRTT